MAKINMNSKKLTYRTKEPNIIESYECYVCANHVSLTELRQTDGQFEGMTADEYTSIIDFLGLHRCFGPSTHFHQGIANVCEKCLQTAISELAKKEENSY